MIDFLIAFFLGFMLGGLAGIICMSLIAMRGKDE